MRGRDSANIIRQLLSSGVVKRRKVGRGYVYSLTETFKDESMIEELIRQAGGASFEVLLSSAKDNSATFVESEQPAQAKTVRTQNGSIGEESP